MTKEAIQRHTANIAFTLRVHILQTMLEHCALLLFVFSTGLDALTRTPDKREYFNWNVDDITTH